MTKIPDDEPVGRVLRNKRKPEQPKADPEERTRASKKQKEEEEEGEGEKLDLSPPKTVDGQKILQSDRPNFEASFKTQWWADHADDVCHICKDPIDEKERSIDHKKAWSICALEVMPQEVCKGGVHWEVILYRDALHQYQKDGNLRPSHKKCNSSKGGQKGNDNICPQRMKKSDCSGEGCELRKAK